MDDHSYCRYEEEEASSAENIILTEIRDIKKLLSKRQKMLNEIRKTKARKKSYSWNWKDIFPAQTVEELNEIDHRINFDRKFHENLVWLLRRLLGPEQTLEDAFKFLAIDEVYIEYNYFGKCNKHSLRRLTLFSEMLFNARPETSRVEFVKEINKSVKRAHNRFHKRETRNRRRTHLLGE